MTSNPAGSSPPSPSCSSPPPLHVMTVLQVAASQQRQPRGKTKQATNKNPPSCTLCLVVCRCVVLCGDVRLPRKHCECFKVQLSFRAGLFLCVPAYLQQTKDSQAPSPSVREKTHTAPATSFLAATCSVGEHLHHSRNFPHCLEVLGLAESDDADGRTSSCDQ